MRVQDAKTGQVVYSVEDYYDKINQLNNPTLARGTITAIDEDSESITVHWADAPAGTEDEHSSEFFFATKQAAIADYIGRTTEYLVDQAMYMD